MTNISNAFTCPFCNVTYKLEEPNYGALVLYFDGGELKSASEYWYSRDVNFDDALKVMFKKCPSCNKTVIETLGKGDQLKDEFTHIHPKSLAKQFPEYIPSSIRQDYEEAYAILHLSPKASATLSRRAMQGMIRDFFEVKPDTLYKEIDQIENQISPTVKKTLNAARKIGNIGAHMENDINTIVEISDGEAEKLIKLNEYLIKNWYIERHDSDTLMKEIQDINTNKQDNKKKH